MPNPRTALVAAPLATVQRYLPSNYTARLAPEVLGTGRELVEITGVDSAGWTLDGYVIPRLASGLMFAREVSSIAYSEIGL